MPVPVILGAIAAITGATGIGVAVHGGKKMKDASDKIQAASRRLEGSKSIYEEQNKKAISTMDAIGKKELEILHSFQNFSDMIEKIQNRPEFTERVVDGVSVPKYDPKELRKVSVGAGVLLGGLSGAVFGTAGGFAAAGATTAAVMALGTASTGTAIASLSGAAATNATLAALGGGAIAAGGGGIALGTTILGAATLGMGLLVGGIIFEFAGSKVSGKADTAVAKMHENQQEMDKITVYLISLNDIAVRFHKTLITMNNKYRVYYHELKKIVMKNGKTDWNQFTDSEKLITENAILLVGLLYKMCQVQLVLKGDDEKSLNKINSAEVLSVTEEMNTILSDRFNVLI